MNRPIQSDFAAFLKSYHIFLDSKEFVTFFTCRKLRLSKIKIDNYFADSEHGFFHGLMASFICFLINNEFVKKKEKNLSKIYASATLHDFLKPNGVPQKEHDIKLREYFDKLCEVTYRHSTPLETDEDEHLIIADRLELRRYSDYKEWVDTRFHYLYQIMMPQMKDKLDIFYDELRPFLERKYNGMLKSRQKINNEIKKHDKDNLGYTEFVSLLGVYDKLKQHMISLCIE